jgi:hypothetical protein
MSWSTLLSEIKKFELKGSGSLILLNQILFGLIWLIFAQPAFHWA